MSVWQSLAPRWGEVTPRAMLRLPADLQTSQWPRRQCAARRLEGAATLLEERRRFEDLRPEDGRAVEPLVLGHNSPRSDPSVGASQACYVNVLKVNPVAIEEPFTISPGSHLAFRLH